MAQSSDATPWVRTGMLLSPEGAKMLDDLVARNPEIGKTTLVEAVVRFIPEETLLAASRKLKAMKNDEAERRRELLKRIRHLSIEELEKLSGKKAPK